FGEDYHHVLKDKLKSLLKFINESITETNGRCFVDSAPVLERDWALRSGNGWVGKNSLMIHPRKGSYFFLAELIIDLEVEYDQPFSKNYCGSCTRCIDACPTGAIAKDGYVVDSNKCISYLTIEYKGEIPSEYKDKFSKWIFGCDICQEVCPWNRFSTSHTEETFNANEKLQNMERSTQWLELTEEVFQQLFRRSAVKRTKYDGLKRNIFFLLK
ncbi:MAG: tRNA epoxyqueuosine(34) reductase QueG, partial [Chitinophagaceae bacterium]|nr:tRNA epoxyqueuosine(34) reductase QueG [Chitinophagaceae bacterium]